MLGEEPFDGNQMVLVTGQADGLASMSEPKGSAPK
jgi:hypothetical protein